MAIRLYRDKTTDLLQPFIMEKCTQQLIFEEIVLD